MLTTMKSILLLLFLSLACNLFGQANFVFDWAGISDGNNFSSMALDKEDNIYVCGNYDYNEPIDLDFSTDVFLVNDIGEGYESCIAKYSKSGEFIWGVNWKAYINSSFSGSIFISKITLDKNGDIVCIGEFLGLCDFDPGLGVFEMQSTYSSNAFVLKLNKNGEFKWAKMLKSGLYSNGNAPNNNSNYLYGLDIDLNNNIVVSGSFGGNVDFDPGPEEHRLETFWNMSTCGFVLSLDVNGNFKWVRDYNSEGQDGISIVHIDVNNDIIVEGYFYDQLQIQSLYLDTTFSSGIFSSYHKILIKMNAEGEELWGIKFGVGSNGYTGNIKSDSKGNIYLVGTFDKSLLFTSSVSNNTLYSCNFILQSSMTGIDAFVAKIEKDGTFLWSKAIGGFNYIDRGVVLEIVSDRIFIGTNIHDTVYYDYQLVFTTPYGYQAGFFEIDESGNYRSSCYLPISIKDMRIDSDNALVSMGHCYSIENNQVDLNPSETDVYYFHEHANGGILHKMRIMPNHSENEGFVLFPNPSSDQITIYAKDISESATLNLFSSNGDLIKTFELTNDFIIIPIETLSNGLYLLRLNSDQKNYVKRFIKN